MPVVKKSVTNPQLGPKVRELFKLVEENEDWERYVAPQTAMVVKEIYNSSNMTKTLEEMGMKYTTARAHLMRALDRIQNKKLDRLRGGQSKQAARLLELMDNEDWQGGLTDREIEIAETFKEVKNFYETARKLDIEPSNVAITLYGSTQKLGVVNKIKRHLSKKG